MKIVETHVFEKDVRTLLKRNHLLQKDYENFKELLTENPKLGAIIIGTGGVRKIRLKSASSGKSGGFRVCYYVFDKHCKITLLLIYAKNVQDNITQAEKRDLEKLVKILEREYNDKRNVL